MAPHRDVGLVLTEKAFEFQEGDSKAFCQFAGGVPDRDERSKSSRDSEAR